MDMIGRIRRLRSRGKKSEREIARMTGLSRNTVAKWLHGEVDGPPKYRRQAQPNKLTPFVEAVTQALKADARRPRHERRTAKALFAQIKAEGYGGGYTRLTDFIRSWRQGEGRGAAMSAFEQGLRVDPKNATLQIELARVDRRRGPVISFLPRSNLINRWLGVRRRGRTSSRALKNAG